MKKFLLMLVICVSSFMFYTNNVKADSYGTYNFGYRHTVTCPNCNNFRLGSNNANAYFNLPQNSYTTVTKSIYSDNTTKFVGDSFLVTIGFIKPIESLNYQCSASNTSNWDGYTYYADGTSSYYTGSGVAQCTAYSLQERTSQFTLLLKYGSHDFSGTVACNLTASSDNGLVYQCPRFQEEQDISRLDFVFNYYADDGVIDFDINLNFTTIVSSVNQINKNTEEIKNDIKNDNTSGAESSADNLKNNSAFQDNTGLSGVISMPLTFVNSLTNTCQPINLSIPYMDVDVTIPCMQSVITDKMPLLANIIKIIVNGFIVYRILLDIFQIVRNAKNPEDDRIEVLDL